MRRLSYLLAISLLSSCTIIRGYIADGAYGPTSFSYDKQLKDTIVNHADVFTFDRPENQADWIDTLHFFNQGRMSGLNGRFPKVITPLDEKRRKLQYEIDNLKPKILVLELLIS